PYERLPLADPARRDKRLSGALESHSFCVLIAARNRAAVAVLPPPLLGDAALARRHMRTRGRHFTGFIDRPVQQLQRALLRRREWFRLCLLIARWCLCLLDDARGHRIAVGVYADLDLTERKEETAVRRIFT